MSSLKSSFLHPSRLMHREPEHCTLAKKSAISGGAIMLGLMIFAFIWMFPEMKRYVQMKRM